MHIFKKHIFECVVDIHYPPTMHCTGGAAHSWKKFKLIVVCGVTAPETQKTKNNDNIFGEMFSTLK